jgi:pantoate--beta-alanine ligase
VYSRVPNIPTRYPRRLAAADKTTLALGTPALLREQVGFWRTHGESVGLVPTMGALHAGHAALVRASKAENARTVVSVFVNPLQFGPDEDFQRYPRPIEKDMALLHELEVDAVYLPSVKTMYPPGATTRVRVGALSDVLEGAFRPGHFEGVATVVMKLFEAARPDRAYFGQKDAQQALLVTLMARELDTGIEVRVVPTVREPDGLAISSRNAYLDPEQRKAALCLARALEAAEAAWEQGVRDTEELKAAMRRVLDAEPLAQTDYAEVVDPAGFGPLLPGGRARAVLAVRIGPVRLIDNHELGRPLGK